MTLYIKNIQINFYVLHHANHQWGATFILPNGKKIYGEYRTVGEVIETVKTNKELINDHYNE